MREGLTIGAALGLAARKLAAAGVSQARLEARLLLCHATRLPVEIVVGHPERALAGEEAACFERLLARRERREPVAQILGRREFWSLSFKVTRDTLTPRPESETLVEAALALVADRAAPLAILDLGTGTGCLLLALLSELPRARGVGVDCSERACLVARENATALGVAGRARFLAGDWGAALSARFDIVIANPPYVPLGMLATLDPEVARFEPHSALAAGPDGLDAYRALAAALPPLLAPDGHVVLELGQGQGDAAAGILAGAGLDQVGRRLDLAGTERCLIMAARRSQILNEAEA